ncbi:hypothetical protein PSHT_10481 [Puccinia striiformis]|uniref:RNA helicase n=1 Tax=Puccinia striiformis TaxID=27350 RepID=A0A2S4V9F8_9BASI|nr:hypothetical protein PSHT_10481 [Puccinia striiformis]
MDGGVMDQSSQSQTRNNRVEMGMGPSPIVGSNGSSKVSSVRSHTSNGGSKQPLSIETLLAQQKAEKEAASKPKFLSKEQRAALAIAKRQEEVAAEKARLAEASLKREELERSAREAKYGGSSYSSRTGGRNGSSDHSYGYNDRRGGSRVDMEGVPTAPKALRGKPSSTPTSGPGPSSLRNSYKPDSTTDNHPSSSMLPPTHPASSVTPDQNGNSQLPSTEPMLGTAPPPVLNQKLLMARYLGQPDNKKRRIRKMSDKKFVFDWAKDEDTALEEVDPLYAISVPSAPPPSHSSNHHHHGTGGSNSRDNRGSATPTATTVVQMVGRFGLYGNGKLAGIDPAVQSKKSGSGARELAQRQGLDPDDEVLTSRPSVAGSKRSSAVVNELHWSQKPLNAMRDRDWRIFREDFSIAARGGNIPNPMRSWEESKLPLQILEIIDETSRSICINLAPTRELAQQIEVESNKFALRLGYRCVSIVGGKAMEEQALNMRDGAEIIIATPGRLKDCIERHVLVLGQCTYVVMDEADRMINLGFEEVVNFILDQLPLSNLKPDTEEAEDSNKMTSFVMFSATMPPAVERLAKKYLRRPAVVTIGVAGQAVDTVDQQVEFLPNEDKKRGRLLEVLNQGHTPPIIVFVNQKKTADQLAKDISRAGWSTTTLHSGKNQEQREAALASLRAGESDILVATDLAGRGIDVPDVGLVVNFQMAGTIEAYVHRIGRTGRAGKMSAAMKRRAADLDDG